MTKKKQQKPGRFMDLTTDFGFKTVFGEKNEALLLSFLNGVFEGRKTVVKINHLQLKQLGQRSKDRDAIFDLYCTDEAGEHYIVEMQVAKQKHFMDRCLFYAAMSIQAQAKKGKWDYELKPLYVISILNCVLWEDNANYINHHSLMNEETLTASSDKLQLITVELPKFTKFATELATILDKWLYCMKHLSELSEQPTEIQGEIFDALFELTELETLTEEDMKTYKESFQRCYGVELAVDYAEERGIEKGMQRGMQQGMQRGRQESSIEIAKNCFLEGMPIDFVVRVTGLTPEQLKEIQ